MIFDAPNTKKNRIAATIAIAFGLGVGFYMSVSDKDNDKGSAEQASILSPTSAPTTSRAPPIVEGGVPSELSDIRKPSDIDFGAYSKDLAKIMGLEVGMPMAEAELKVLNKMAPEQGGEGNAVFEMDKFQGYVGGQAFVATIDSMSDDSVRAQQLYAIGKKNTDETYSLVDYGMRVKCWRGDNQDNWQTSLCP